MNKTRKFWLDTMADIILPVLEPLSCDCLREVLPVDGKNSRTVYEKCTYLEAFGRILAGIAPWLGLRNVCGEEKKLQQKIISLVHKGLENATDPGKKDYMNFSRGGQPVVDAAFLAQGILRAPEVLWEPLEDKVKNNIINALKQTRTRKPCYNNWLLFSAMTETLLCYAGDPTWDPMRIDFAVKQHLNWYKGDGIFGDGEELHCDYYNSFVIHPMLYEILRFFKDREPDWGCHSDEEEKRLSRYATILERLIAPDGSYPLMGRSLAYRFGVFHALSLACYYGITEESVSVAGVRCGLTQVIKKVISFSDMKDEKGYLRVGILGAEKELTETYISTGSLYLCCMIFTVLGLDEEHPFWNLPDELWTSKKLWKC